MINSTININSAENLFESNNITISSSSNLIASDVVRISMQISDTSNDVVDASLNINSNGLKLDIYNSQEYAKHASLFFGSLFTGGFNADYMWQLLAAPTSEQINGSHLIDALSPIEADIQALADAFQLHFTNWNIHLTQEDRDFITRLKAIYGTVYNVALDYLILTNPYEGPINITNSQIALYAGFGGFSAYSSVTDIEVEYYNLLALPTKSGGIPTAEAYASQNNTYGFGITTLTIPTTEPTDLVRGETAVYVGEGGFTSFASNDDEAVIIEGYYFEDFFYLDEEHTIPADMLAGKLYIDLVTNKIYRYDEEEAKFILLAGAGGGGFIEGFFNIEDDLFYEHFENDTYSSPIEGKPDFLYLDKTTKELYTYNEELEIFEIISSAVEPFVIKGYFNATDGNFYSSYEEGVYADPVRPNPSKIYFDLNSKFVYLYDPAVPEFVRYHHKISVDYLVFNTNYPNNVTVGPNQAAFYITNLGFSSFIEPITDELLFGYFFNDGFYLEDTHETLVTPDGLMLYIDKPTNKIYRYDAVNELYVLLSSAASGGTGSGIFFGYYSAGDFYSDIELTTQITPTEGGVYVDRVSGDFYVYDTDNYEKYFTQISVDTLESNPKTLIIAKDNELPKYNVTHNAGLLPTLTANQSNDIVNNSTVVIPSSSVITRFTTRLGHITSVNAIPYSITLPGSSVATIAQRDTDSSLAASYLKLSEGVQNVSISSGQFALFAGGGGFSATTAGEINLIYSWEDIDIGEYSDNAYQSYVVYTKVNSLENRITILEQTGGDGEGGPGTTDHNLLTHRFSEDFENDEEEENESNDESTPQTHYQHDTAVIRGLAELFAATNANIAKMASSTWQATPPVVFTHTETTENNATVSTNTIALQPLVVLEPQVSNTLIVEAQNSGYVLSNQTSYAENVGETINEVTTYRRVLQKVPIAYNTAAAAASIVKRTSDAALAASYILLTDNVSNITLPNLTDVALYSGTGGFTAHSSGDNYYLYGNWPDPERADDFPIKADSVICAQALYDKITEIYEYIENIDATGEGGGGGKTYVSGPGIFVSSQPNQDDEYPIRLLPPALEDVENEVPAALGGVKYGFPKTEETNNIKYPLTAILQSSSAHAYEAYTQIDKASASTFGVTKLGDSTSDLSIGGRIFGIGANSNGQLLVQLPEMSASNYGVAKLGNSNQLTISSENKIYGVGITSTGQLAVNVPWSGSSYGEGKGISISNNTISVDINDFLYSGTYTGQRYRVEYASNTGLYVDVPWTDNDTTYSATNGVILNGTTFSIDPNYVTTESDVLDWVEDAGYFNSAADIIREGFINSIWVNGTQMSVSEGRVNIEVSSGSSVTESTVRSWGFAYQTEIPEVPEIPSWINNVTITSSNISDWNGKADLSDIPDVSHFIRDDENGSISGTLTATKFYDSSDIRLKKNIKELISVIDSIEDIPIVEYEMKRVEGSKYIGTLAQKLLPLFPELVGIDSEGYYNVDYGGLAAIAIQGIKELYRKLKDLESKVYGD